MGRESINILSLEQVFYSDVDPRNHKFVRRMRVRREATSQMMTMKLGNNPDIKQMCEQIRQSAKRCLDSCFFSIIMSALRFRGPDSGSGFYNI